MPARPRRTQTKETVPSWIKKFQDAHWQVQDPPEQPPALDFTAIQGNRVLLVEVKTVRKRATLTFPASRLQDGSPWAVAITWRRHQHDAEWLLIPAAAWKDSKDDGPFRVTERGLLLRVHERHATQLLAYRWTPDAAEAASMAPIPVRVSKPPKAAGSTSLALLRADPDVWEPREIRQPRFMPRALQGKNRKPGANETRSLGNRRVNAKLLDAFEELLRDNSVDMTWFLEHTMAWQLGVDCPDTPYPIPEALREVRERLAKGERLPTYYRPRPPSDSDPAPSP